jgi:hypothetical protein
MGKNLRFQRHKAIAASNHGKDRIFHLDSKATCYIDMLGILSRFKVQCKHQRRRYCQFVHVVADCLGVFESDCGDLLDYFGIFGLCICGIPVTRLLQNLAKFWKGKSFPRLLASKIGGEALLNLTVASIKLQK